ncbi:MAG TPA: type 1 glutamine amidotransferase [Acidimicrobiales bacterium]|nr:type 1 glutamine amidotransferase [Acidimicrobiales bacterium]
MPRCLIVQHVAAEGPYRIAEALERAGVGMDVRRVFAPEALPADLEGHDGLVVMGGPMSAYSDDGFPSRRAELDLLGQALATGRPVLGVCLGAQLLASAAGAGVYAGGATPEIGWGPVTLTPACADDPLLHGLPEQVGVLHWHGDTFDVPAGAEHLARTDLYPSQAFRAGERAWGLQFHLEVDAIAVAAFLDAFGSDTLGAGTTPEAIADEAPAALAALEEVQGRVLDRFAALVASRAREPLAERA